MRERRWRHTQQLVYHIFCLASPMDVPVFLPRSLSLPPGNTHRTTLTSFHLLSLGYTTSLHRSKHPSHPHTFPLLSPPPTLFLQLFFPFLFPFLLHPTAPQSHGPGQTNLPSIHIHLRSVPSQAPLRFLAFFSFFRMQLAFPFLTALNHRSHLIHNLSFGNHHSPFFASRT